jgi:ATP-dependent DNA helicase RecG
MTSSRNSENETPEPVKGSGPRGPGTRIPLQVRNLSRLAASVTALSGVGSAYSKKLGRMGIETLGDLLYHLPRRYLDRSSMTPIGSLRTGQQGTVVGRVCEVESRRTRGRKNILTVTLFDGSGYLSGVWFNQEYHRQRLSEGSLAAFSGKVQYKYNRLQIVNPSYDVLGGAGEDDREDSIHTGRIIPVYPATAGVTSAVLRRLISAALDAVSPLADFLPEEILGEFHLLPLQEAVRQIHFPDGADPLKRARFRATFEEVFIMQVGLALMRKWRESKSEGIAFGQPGPLISSLLSGLPFELTSSQKRAWEEIVVDMTRLVRMNRLLQGEVGSGKTVVAVMAMLLAVEGGRQAAIMAPTEVLAHQHFRRIGELLEGIPVVLELVTRGSPESVLEKISAGDVDVVVGTHALLEEKVSFSNLGLVVVDEQHRFGLRQRVSLSEKAAFPEVLHMSATPIPRTLSMTLYGDLEISVIDELPSGRKGVVTVVADRSQRKGALKRLAAEVEEGRQVFVVCPLIEKSDKLEAKAASEEAKKLAGEFPGFRVELIHGQMKSDDKRSIMERFQDGEIDILISTVLIEVGIDVPNATAMLIENADRFGLAQLHQLRGRVGRGEARGLCVLMADPATEEAKARLEAIKVHEDGFSLAEEDLRIRGEGSVFGIRQSGLPDLKLARLDRDFELIRRARKEAFRLVDRDPRLENGANVLLKWETRRRFEGELEWLFRG